jgi:isopropylmalate/homocitrate/citramalate synthase
MIPRRVTVVEVGPRDGLQNEKAAISTADKVAFVNRLSRARLPVVEVTAFVSPKWVPQMADAADVLAAIERAPGARYTALVPNRGIGDFQPAQHQSKHRRIVEDVSGRHSEGTGAGAPRPGLPVDGLRLPVRGFG